MTLPGWVGVREPRGRLGGRYAKNVTICPTQACTTPHGTRAITMPTYSMSQGLGRKVTPLGAIGALSFFTFAQKHSAGFTDPPKRRYSITHKG